MKILITGVAGFIGYNLANNFLKKGFTVYGIDNFDNYYSIKIKKERIKILKKNKKFLFNILDISKYNNLNNYIKKKKIDIIIHLAAQAGVRYSLINPNKYLDTNLSGFINLIKSIEKKKIKKFLYASSSSVYGDSKKFPLKEKSKLQPKSIYGLSKKMNEELALQYSKIYKTKFVGLRFFTIYGEWGRPDMFMMKLFKSSKLNKTFYLNNYGNHKRDFTYIGDVVKIIEKLIRKKINKHEIFNICSNNPINIYDIVKKFRKNNNLNLKLIQLNKADVLKTHGDNSKIKKFVSFYKFSKFDMKFLQVLNWFKTNKIEKL